MIDASTLVMPGPKNVLRPALPHVPSAFSAKAPVLNHRAGVRSSRGRFGSCPGTRFGRSWPPPVFDRSVPTYPVRGNPLAELRIVLNCQPPRIAAPTPLSRNGLPAPNGNSYRIDATKRWRTSNTDSPHSHSRQKLSCGNSVSPLSVRIPLPLSVDL